MEVMVVEDMEEDTEDIMEVDIITVDGHEVIMVEVVEALVEAQAEHHLVHQVELVLHQVDMVVYHHLHQGLL